MIEFTKVPEWTYEGKTPSIHTFFESIALADLEFKRVRLDSKTQNKLLGVNVFGKREIVVTDNGQVNCTISCCFGRDFESSSYSSEVLQQAVANRKQLKPGFTGKNYG